MTITPYLRWHERKSYVKNGESFAFPHTERVLQQFWIVGKDESDITIEKDVSPDGLFYGRWKDVP